MLNDDEDAEDVPVHLDDVRTVQRRDDGDSLAVHSANDVSVGMEVDVWRPQEKRLVRTASARAALQACPFGAPVGAGFLTRFWVVSAQLRSRTDSRYPRALRSGGLFRG